MIEIQEAGPVNLLKTITVLVLIYYTFKWLIRLLAPFLVKKVMDIMQKKAADQFGNTNRDTVKRGETVIDKKPAQQESNDAVGEYIDFEEIE